mmetsp:Transcript_47900/g.153504  ORF Transcript_47900/g.153504 Transcript_47900/m.153504 type:complete len:223 (-) Transcript_47900:748-1416(-)
MMMVSAEAGDDLLDPTLLFFGSFMLSPSARTRFCRASTLWAVVWNSRKMSTRIWIRAPETYCDMPIPTQSCRWRYGVMSTRTGTGLPVGDTSEWMNSLAATRNSSGCAGIRTRVPPVTVAVMFTLRPLVMFPTDISNFASAVISMAGLAFPYFRDASALMSMVSSPSFAEISSRAFISPPYTTPLTNPSPKRSSNLSRPSTPPITVLPTSASWSFSGSSLSV